MTVHERNEKRIIIVYSKVMFNAICYIFVVWLFYSFIITLCPNVCNTNSRYTRRSKNFHVKSEPQHVTNTIAAEITKKKNNMENKFIFMYGN